MEQQGTRRNWGPSLLLMGILLAVAPEGSATTVDLTGGEGSSGTINGVLFEYDDTQTAGTGVLQPFLRLQAGPTEQGYNTSNPDFGFDEHPPADMFTRDLQFGELAPIGGMFLFMLDINESNGGTASLLSLDALQIYVSGAGSQNTTDLASLGTLIYDLDAGADSVVLLDFLNAGSGVSDMLMSVPESFFAGVSANDFVILYSRFGDTDSSDAGFEEWGHVVPASASASEPSVLLLSGLALLGLAVARRTC